MGYTALYREWRPKSFDEVVGQKHVTITLKNQIKSSRIAHAYLLCGTRGTGKTSTAKILAKAVNCLDLKDGEPCNECEMCKKINAGIAIDVKEIDAASHNGVDNIRDIIDDVQYPPQEARYKVFVIDEVHMLSIGAVNAFLKTLEEPPKNVIFILATTDPQKLPVTILSRVQRFDFKRIKKEDIFDRLRVIVEEQGVFADDKSIQLIARISDGAMRDALSILDQAISMGDGKVDYNQVINMLGLVTNENLLKLTDEVIDKNIEHSMKIIDDVVFDGKDINLFIKDMISHMRNLLMVKVSHNPNDILDMSEENLKLLKQQSEKIRIEEIMRDIRILQEAEEQSKWSKQTRIYLELAIIKICKIEYDTSKEVLLARINKIEQAIREGNIVVNTTNEQPKEENKRHSSDYLMNKIKASSKSVEKKQSSGMSEEVFDESLNSEVTLDIIKKSWKDILEVIKGRRQMVIYASLMTGKPVACKDGIIEIKYDKDFSFNKNRMEKEENKKIVEDILGQFFKGKVKLRFTVDEPQKHEKSKEEILKETFGDELVEIIDE